jgi:Domain of unknown function (DUF4157)
MKTELTIRHRSPAIMGGGPSLARILQRKCACGGQGKSGGECEECKKKKIQRQAISANRPDTAPPIVHDVLRSSGQPLDRETRAFFEPRFEHDFGRVRVHADEKAAESARAVNALAFTVGQNIVFGSGQYRPGEAQGDHLLAHELTHVFQQRGMADSRGDAANELPVETANSSLEFEAEKAAADLALPGRKAASASSLVLHRSTADGDSTRGSTLPRRQAIALTECIAKMGEKNADYCRQQVMGASERQLQPGAPAGTVAATATSAALNTVKAGETGCEIRTGKVKIEIDRDQHPQCMWDCVTAHEDVHSRDQGQKCQDLFKLHSDAATAGQKADATNAPADKQAAEEAFKKLEAAIKAYEQWFTSGCKDREKKAYQAGINKCSTPADRCKNNTAEFNQIMSDWRGWAQNPPPTNNCP